MERLRLSTSPTFIAVVVELATKRAHASSPDKTLLYNYTRCRQVRPVADSEAQSTRRRLHSVADLPAPTTCRRLRHIRDATVSIAPAATASTPACRQRRQSCAGTAS